MAYTPGQKLEGEEDEAQGGQAPAAPTISGPAAVGGNPSVGGTVAGSSPVAQSNASGGGAGTGFVNIDQYLGANKGVGQAVKAKGDEALDKDYKAFSGKADETKTNIATNKTKIVGDPSSLVGGVLGATGEDQKAAAIKTAQDAIGATFSGASTVDYDVGNTEDAKRANALGNANSAGKQIAKDSNTLSQYGTGLQAIDAALYGSAQEAPALQSVAERSKSQIGSEKNSAADIAEKAAITAANIKGSADNTRKAFETKRDELFSDADAKATAANEKTQADYRDKILRDPVTGEVVAVPEGQKVGAWEGNDGNATRENFLDANGLSAIGSVIGDSQLAATMAGPAYESGRYTTERGDGVYDTGQLETAAVRTKQSDELDHAKNINSIKNKPHKEGENNQQQLVQYVTLRKMRPDIAPEDLMKWIENGGGSEEDFMNLSGAQYDENGERQNRVGQLQLKGVK